MSSYGNPSNKDLIFPGITIVLACLLTAGGIWAASNGQDRVIQQREQVRFQERIRSGDLIALEIGQPIPGDDPFNALWEQAPPVDVPVQPQRITTPMLDSPSITSVRVQALSDGEWIAWRLQWNDANADMNVEPDKFCDAVAVQFPLVRNASPYMGAKDMQVQIIHWKALWQKDIDEHFQDVQDLHPNYWSDLYWFAKQVPGTTVGEARYRVPESFEDPVSLQWFPAYQAGNPMADFRRIQPVQELYAEGFGSLTPQKESASMARGIWKDGQWTVVFSRPLYTNDPLDCQLHTEAKRKMSVAVWEGSAGNVGGRKHWSDWFTFSIEAKP